jgi:hypothetical protein
MIKNHDESNALTYADGQVAEPVFRGEAPVTEVRIVGCRGRPRTLRTRGFPENLDPRGGVLTWDTGQFTATEEKHLSPHSPATSSLLIAVGHGLCQTSR